MQHKKTKTRYDSGFESDTSGPDGLSPDPK